MKNIVFTATLLFLNGYSESFAEMPSGYPKSCEKIDYCGPVSNMEWVTREVEGYAELRVAASFGNAAIRSNVQITKSADERSHVCMRYDAFGNLEVTCLMVPMPSLQASTN